MISDAPGVHPCASQGHEGTHNFNAHLRGGPLLVLHVLTSTRALLLLPPARDRVFLFLPNAVHPTRWSGWETIFCGTTLKARPRRGIKVGFWRRSGETPFWCGERKGGKQRAGGSLTGGRFAEGWAWMEPCPVFLWFCFVFLFVFFVPCVCAGEG